MNVPAGYYESGSPFSLAFFGEPWSEAELIGMAYDYEQSTEYREAPQLTVEEEETTTGGELPETATNYAMYVLSGLLLTGFSLTGLLLVARNRREHQQFHN